MRLTFVHLPRIEQIRREGDATENKALHKFRSDTGRTKSSLQMAVLIQTHLLISKDFLERYDVTFHSRNLLHTGDSPRTVRQTCQMDDDVERGRNIMSERFGGEIQSSHGDERLDAS